MGLKNGHCTTASLPNQSIYGILRCSPGMLPYGPSRQGNHGRRRHAAPLKAVFLASSTLPPFVSQAKFGTPRRIQILLKQLHMLSVTQVHSKKKF